LVPGVNLAALRQFHRASAKSVLMKMFLHLPLENLRRYFNRSSPCIRSQAKILHFQPRWVQFFDMDCLKIRNEELCAMPNLPRPLQRAARMTADGNREMIRMASFSSVALCIVVASVRRAGARAVVGF